jgi:CAAX prenyl protease-like protein
MQRAWPYLAPYAVLLACAELARWLPASADAPLLALRVLLPAALLGVAARRGAFPELAPGPSAAGAVLDVGFGLAIAALWLAPYLIWPTLPRGEPFDPDALGESLRPAWMALRLLGFVAVSPLVEELFVRSFLHRVAEGWPDWASFWQRPLAQPHRFAFLVTGIWFTLSHAPWEWWVAIPTAALLNGWLYLRGQLRSVWIAHAAANFAIGGLVAYGPWSLWSFL